MRPFRFELFFGYVLGVALPVLEVMRRRTHFEDIPAYLDDLLAGALLLWAARSVSRRRSYGPYLLAGVWGIVCGGLWASFFGQLGSSETRDISGLPNAVVVFVKGLIYLLALTAFSLSVWRRSQTDHDVRP